MNAAAPTASRPTPPAPPPHHLAATSDLHAISPPPLPQASPAKLVQYITFAAIECNLTATANCLTREADDTVKLVHAGVESPTKVSLTASPAAIAASFATLVDGRHVR